MFVKTVAVQVVGEGVAVLLAQAKPSWKFEVYFIQRSSVIWTLEHIGRSLAMLAVLSRNKLSEREILLQIKDNKKSF